MSNVVLMGVGKRTEVCKVDGEMSEVFKTLANSPKAKVYCVCEYSGMKIKLDKPEYRNNVTYVVEVE